jgi:hypothetical protein
MAAFRCKPLLKEAVQYMDLSPEGKPQFETFDTRVPRWLGKAFDKGVLFVRAGRLFVRTLEGTMIAKDGCYIVRGIKGEIYPCEETIFEQSYELLHPAMQ